MTAWYRVETPWSGGPDAGGAIACVAVGAPDGAGLARALAGLVSALPAVGGHALARLPDLDDALVVRTGEAEARVMPHGSSLVVRRLVEALRAAGCAELAASDAAAAWPEAPDLVGALMLETLWRAPSPLALGALAAQAELWRSGSGDPPDEAHDRAMGRLLAPPTVALVGPSNVGKSTLTNALAGERVAVVADEPGTTRDHVGVALTLDGLAVRWIDCPGLRAGASGVEAEAAAIAREAVAGADLVVSCADAASAFVEPSAAGARGGTPVIRCATRADLGPPAGGDPAVSTAALRREGLATLAVAVRSALLPDETLGSRRRWRFHGGLAGTG